MWYDKLVDCDKPNYPDIELSICPKRWSTMCGPWDIWWGPLHEATEIYRSCKHAGSIYRILCITFCTSASVTLAPTVRVREEGHKKSKTFWFLMLVVVCLCSRAGVYLAAVQVFIWLACCTCLHTSRCEHRRDGCEILDDMLGWALDGELRAAATRKWLDFCLKQLLY